MTFLKKFVLVAAVATGLLGITSQSRADLFIRMTATDAANAVVATSLTGPVATPPFPAGINTGTITVGNFILTVSNNTATSTAAATNHTFTLNTTRNAGAGVNLIVEIFGSNYTQPGVPRVIDTNASPSTVGSSGTINLVSGVSLTNAGLNALGATHTLALASAGFTTGQTTQSGPFGAGASSVLSPNPATGAAFGGGTFSFLQVLALSFGSSTGPMSLSGASEVTAVPAPAGVVLALTTLPMIGARFIRRRKVEA